MTKYHFWPRETAPPPAPHLRKFLEDLKRYCKIEFEGERKKWASGLQAEEIVHLVLLLKSLVKLMVFSPNTKVADRLWGDRYFKAKIA